MSDSDEPDSTRYRSSRRQPQTQQPDPVKCPRCDSTNTKFCYYNNYNKTQPRHFCKACKRYWTKGGTLRNVPVGGGRKNKRLRYCPVSNTANPTTATVISNRPSIDHQDSLFLGLSDSKDSSSDVVNKDSFFKPTGSEKSDDHVVESYTDIEELKGLVSWDFYGSFVGCTMQQFAKLEDGPSSYGTNPSSYFIEKFENDQYENTTTTSMIMSSSQQWKIPITSNFLEMNSRNWKELDTMVLEDLNKPWEDPTFKT